MHILSQTAYAILSMPCLMLTLGAPLTRRCWAKDRAGRYLWINDNFATDLGRESSALVGRSTMEVWPQCWREILRVDRLVIEGRIDVLAHEEELELGAGTALVSVTRIPLVDDKGVVVGVAGFYDGLPAGELARRHERQLMLAALTEDGHAFVEDGMRAFVEEFSA